MPDQADKLRQLVSDASPCVDSLGPLPPTIVVTGGKGGVGTTTVALNLAVAMAQSGRRTVLVDVAANADAAQLAGIDTSTGPTLSDVLVGASTTFDALRVGPSGLQFLASRWDDAELAQCSPRMLDRLFHELHSLDDHADLLVVDTGSGMSHVTRRFWQTASVVLLVTASDDMAVMDAYATLKAGSTGEVAADLRTLVNRCDTAAQAAAVHQRIAGTCRRFLGRAPGTAPRLPLHPIHSHASMSVPRAWEEHTTPFARSVHQLARFAADALARDRRSRGDAFNASADAHEFAKC